MASGTGQVTVRRAGREDIGRLTELLHDVLEVHAAIRPDIFIPGTVKYTTEELEGILQDDTRPVYTAADGQGRVVGYAFCQLQQQPFSNTMIPFTSMFIDDLCVDPACRGQHIGQALFEHVKAEARRLGCYEITLNVWAGNGPAERFYESMGMKTQERRMEYIL